MPSLLFPPTESRHDSSSEAAVVSVSKSVDVFSLQAQEWPSLSGASSAPQGRHKQLHQHLGGLSRQTTASGHLSSQGSARDEDECMSDSYDSFAQDSADNFDVACLVGVWLDSFGHVVNVSADHHYEHPTFEAVLQRDAAPVKKCLITQCSLKQDWKCDNGRLVQANSTSKRIIWLQEDGSENAWTRQAFVDGWQGYEDDLSISAEKSPAINLPLELETFNIATPRQFFSMATPRHDSSAFEEDDKQQTQPERRNLDKDFQAS